MIKQFAALGLPIVIFLLLGLFYLTSAGLNYDETLYINGALGDIPNAMIYKKFLGLPLMITPYLGALKSYLFFPIFKWFGINLYTIRIPVILISAMTLVLWYKVAKELLNEPRFLFIFLMLLATDPAFIIHSRFDFGPIVLQNFLIALTMYLFFKCIKQNSFYHFAWIFPVLLLGLFNKLNFIWFIASFLVATSLFYRTSITQLYQKNMAAFAVVITVFFIILISMILFLSIPAAAHFQMGAFHHDIYNRAHYALSLYLKTMNGSEPFFYIFNYPIELHSLTNFIEIICLISWAVMALMFKAQSKRIILFFLTLFFFEFFLLIATPQIWGSHHIMILWPLNHLLFILMLYSITQIFSKKIVWILIAGSLIMITSQLYTSYEYLDAIKTPESYKNSRWSPSIYVLSRFINNHVDQFDGIISANFGIHNALFSLAPSAQRFKFHDVWYILSDNPSILNARTLFYPQFNKPYNTNMTWLYDEYFNGKNNLIITDTRNQPDLLSHFATKYLHNRIALLSIIYDGHGNPVYRIYDSK